MDEVRGKLHRKLHDVLHSLPIKKMLATNINIVLPWGAKAQRKKSEREFLWMENLEISVSV